MKILDHIDASRLKLGKKLLEREDHAVRLVQSIINDYPRRTGRDQPVEKRMITLRANFDRDSILCLGSAMWIGINPNNVRTAEKLIRCASQGAVEIRRSQ